MSSTQCGELTDQKRWGEREGDSVMLCHWFGMVVVGSQTRESREATGWVTGTLTHPVWARGGT